MSRYEIISFIPVRASKKMPRKNIEMIAGKPLLAWTIEASLKSNYITRTFVSTEDKEIKEVALKYGAEVIDRPAKYSKDGETMLEWEWLVLDFKQRVWDMGCRPDYMIELMVNFPLRTSKHIDEAFELMFSKNEHFVIGVIMDEKILSMGNFAWVCKTMDSDGLLSPAYPRNLLPADVRTFHGRDWHDTVKYEKQQGRGRLYWYNNAIVAGEFSSFSSNWLAVDQIKVGYVMDKWDSVFILHTMEDFKVVEFLLKERIKKEEGI